MYLVTACNVFKNLLENAQNALEHSFLRFKNISRGEKINEALLFQRQIYLEMISDGILNR